MKLTSKYTRVRIWAKKKKKKKYNPYAICHSSLPDNVSDEKYDRCVKHVKNKK